METVQAQLARAGAPVAAAGHTLALYGTVLVLAMIGGLKFTAYEGGDPAAGRDQPPSKLGPCCVQRPGLLQPPGDDRARHRAPPGAVPARPARRLLAAGTFAITSTFLITGPAWEPSLGGFPALSPAGGFLVKDLVLLGVALSVLGQSLSRLAGASQVGGHRPPSLATR